MSLPSKPHKESELKVCLEYSKKRVTELQIFATGANYHIKDAAGLLDVQLSSLAGRSSQVRTEILEEIHSPENATKASIEFTLNQLSQYSAMLEEHAKSLVDIKKLDAMIAEVEFEIFSPPHRISGWTDWTSHQRQTQTKNLKDLAEAVDWWEDMCHYWLRIRTTAVQIQDALERDIDCLQAINMAFDALNDGLEGGNRPA